MRATVTGRDKEATPLLIDRRDDDIVVLTINRRHAVNSVSFELWEHFSAALDAIERDTPVRGLVLTGAGGFFSIGGDVRLPPARGDGALAPAARLELGQRIITRLRRLPVPVIAAVEGGAYGMGWGLALSADLLFAAEDASFGAPFIDYGTVPDGGAAWLLERQVGRLRAAELIFSGRSIGAKEALSLGLASRLCPPGQALSDALAFAAEIGKGNRQAAELAKRLLQQASESNLESNFALELAFCAICQTGDEVVRAREAFNAARAEAKKG